MKKLVILGMICILALPLMVVGCGSGSSTIEITLDEFTAQNHIVKDVEMSYPGSLTIKLGSNPTTGYSWEDAVINNTVIIAQASREYIGSENTEIVGAGGTDVWAFNSKKAGTAIINFSYSRPWEGGEKGIYTLTVNVTVK